jgi:Trk-type K+ transport system membrane component
MNGFWLISYLILWLVVIGGALGFFAMAREMETLHKKLDTLEKFLRHSPSEKEK